MMQGNEWEAGPDRPPPPSSESQRPHDSGLLGALVVVALLAGFPAHHAVEGAEDKLIAAHAVALGVTLVTNNETDFAGYPGLKVENWVAPRL
jgi:hypothetical protein